MTTRIVASVLFFAAVWVSPSWADSRSWVGPAPGGPDVTVLVVAGHPGATPSDTTEGLEDAARELRDAINHKKGLRVVDKEPDAAVVVEVTDREARDTGGGGFGGLKVTSLDERIIRFKVKWGEAETDMKGVGQGSWSRAAKDGAERLLKWIARHEARR